MRKINSELIRKTSQEKLELDIYDKYGLTLKDIERFISSKSKKKHILTGEEISILSKKFALLGYRNKMTLREIGEELNLSESTISTRLHKALLKIYSVKY